MNLVEVKNNQIVVSSKRVAETFEKGHREILRSIRNLQSVQNCTDWFQQGTYKDKLKRTYPIYYMNRDGFSLLTMGLTGKKALEWKIKYIQAFNAMEEALKQKTTVPATTFERVTYKGEIMMQSMHLVQITHIPNASLLFKAKQHGLSHYLLIGDDLKAFKATNNLRTCASRIVLYPKDTVIALLRIWRFYDDFEAVMRGYFNIPNPEAAKGKEPVISCNVEVLHTAINRISKELNTLDGLLHHLPRFKRTVRSHEMLLNIADELAIAILTDTQKMHEKLELIKA